MEMISLTNEMALARAVESLQKGGVILYPTDTLYGLGADAFSNSAVDTVYAIKERPQEKTFGCIVSDIEMAERYGEIDDRVRLLEQKLPKGKVTFVVRKKPELNTGVVRGLETFGFRIPDNMFCNAMCVVFGKPITATSANKSGLASERSIGPLLAQLGSTLNLIDVVVNGGELPESLPSTVVDLTGDEVKVLREGVVTQEQIATVLSAGLH